MDEVYFDETSADGLERIFKDYLIELIQKSNNAFPFSIVVNGKVRVEV